MNWVEGRPLSETADVPLLVDENGSFQYSFIGLLKQSLGGNRRALEAQLYREIRAQLGFWKRQMGEGTPISIDSHQHTHMIPLVFKTLMRAIRDEQVTVSAIRIPAEPLSPYLLTPSLYTAYPLTGLIKQWLLKCFGLINRRELKRADLPYALFMGAVFSGHLTEDKIAKLLPRYARLAEKCGRDIEVALHPGYLEEGEHLIEGCRPSFETFYFSPWRKKEYDALMHLTRYTSVTKEGTDHAVYRQ